MSLTATPQEFDAGFIDALRGYREVRQSLAQQAEATKEVLEAAKAASVKKASDATTKAGTPKSAASTADHAKPAPAMPARKHGDDDGPDDGAPASETVAAAVATAGGESFDLFG